MGFTVAELNEVRSWKRKLLTEYGTSAYMY